MEMKFDLLFSLQMDIGLRHDKRLAQKKPPLQLSKGGSQNFISFSINAPLHLR
jgi:hypothetical protein